LSRHGNQVSLTPLIASCYLPRGRIRRLAECIPSISRSSPRSNNTARETVGMAAGIGLASIRAASVLLSGLGSGVFEDALAVLTRGPE